MNYYEFSSNANFIFSYKSTVEHIKYKKTEKNKMQAYKKIENKKYSVGKKMRRNERQENISSGNDTLRVSITRTNNNKYS